MNTTTCQRPESPAMHYRLRTPTRHDIPKLVAVGRDTFMETFGHMYSDADNAIYIEKVYSPEVIEQELSDPELTFQVLDNGTEFIGYAKIGKVRVPVDNVLPSEQELRQIYIRNEYQGMKLGRVLMDWAMREFESREVSGVYVSVFSENQRAIRFYEEYGFEKVGEYGFVVGNHVDREWIMKRTI